MAAVAPNQFPWFFKPVRLGSLDWNRRHAVLCRLGTAIWINVTIASPALPSSPYKCECLHTHRPWPLTHSDGSQCGPCKTPRVSFILFWIFKYNFGNYVIQRIFKFYASKVKSAKPRVRDYVFFVYCQKYTLRESVKNSAIKRPIRVAEVYD